VLNYAHSYQAAVVLPKSSLAAPPRPWPVT